MRVASPSVSLRPTWSSSSWDGLQNCDAAVRSRPAPPHIAPARPGSAKTAPLPVDLLSGELRSTVPCYAIPPVFFVREPAGFLSSDKLPCIFCSLSSAKQLTVHG